MSSNNPGGTQVDPSEIDGGQNLNADASADAQEQDEETEASE